jgi:hypothetical protein
MRTRNLSGPITSMLLLVCGLGLAISHAQDWVRTEAPFQLWSGVACSTDGAKIIASSRFTSKGGFGPGGLYVSTNSGRTWQITSAPVQYWDHVASSADGTRLAATGANTDTAFPPSHIYVSTDSGATWTQTSAPATNWVGITSSADGSKLAAIVWAGCIYYSLDGGANWSPGNVVPRYWQALAGSTDGHKLIASGGDPYAPSKRDVFMSNDSGPTWNLVVGAPTAIIGLTASADGGKWFGAAGNSGVVTSDDGGKDWNLTSAPIYPYEWLGIAASADGRAVSVVGIIPETESYSPGPIYTSTDYGKNWSQRGTVSGYFNTIACSSDGAKWVAAEGGIAGGYIYTFQTPPVLSIQASGKDVLLSWPASATDFVPQQKVTVDAVSTWQPVTNTITHNESGFQTSVPRTASQSIFRLVSQ